MSSSDSPADARLKLARAAGGSTYVDSSGTIQARPPPTVVERLLGWVTAAWTLLILLFRSLSDPEAGKIGFDEARRSGRGGGGGGGGGGGRPREGRIRNTAGTVSSCQSQCGNGCG